MIRSALTLALRGWRIHPLRPREKTPVTPHGCLDASYDPEVIKEWWDRWPWANIGVATGAGSGVVVIDVDGPQGWWRWAELCSEHGTTETLVQQTGRADGGMQLFFAHPGRHIGNRGALAGCGDIQVRGDGGYVVVPPSVHPSGRCYRWTQCMRPAAMPQWLLELVQEADRPPTNRPPPKIQPGQGTTSYGEGALESACEEARAVGQGQRAVRLFHLASCMGELVAGGELAEDEARAALTAAGMASGISERESDRQVRCGIEAGFRKPRGAPR